MSKSDQETTGKQPKSVDGIRASLTSITGRSNTEPRSGPLIKGFAPDSQIVAGTFLDHDIATSFQDLLGKHNIFSKRIKSRRAVKIVVDAEDCQQAAKLFLQHHEQFPDRRPKHAAQRYDYLVFGIVTGLAVSLIFIDWKNLDDNPLAAVIPISFAVFLGMIGHLVDRLRVNKQRMGRVRVGVWEFMIVVTLPVLVILVKDLVFKAIFPVGP